MLFLAAVCACRTEQPPSEGGFPAARRVPLQAVIVSDDGGEREARVDRGDVSQAVDFANRVYGPGGMGFDFDPDEDVTTLKSTLLNDLGGAGDTRWLTRKRLGNAVAAEYPGKITVLFRHGPGDRPTSGGFSGTDYAFVTMPGLRDASHCGHPHVDALAHEIGHYLGLPHTFAHDPFESESAAESYLRERGGSPEVFDGDGFDDTPPDPGIRHLECRRQAEVELAGVRFELPRHNVMSYYDERDRLSAQQFARARWVLSERLAGDGMALPVNAGDDFRNRLEAEDSTVLDVQRAHAAPQPMDRFGVGDWSEDAQLFVGAQENGTLTLRLPVERSGSYTLRLYATRAPDFGTVQVLVDDRAVGEPRDLYAPIVMPTGPLDLGRVSVTTGEHRLGFRVTGRNRASTANYFGIDSVELVP